jgi:hypothetical protein
MTQCTVDNKQNTVETNTAKHAVSRSNIQTIDRSINQTSNTNTQPTSNQTTRPDHPSQDPLQPSYLSGGAAFSAVECTQSFTQRAQLARRQQNHLCGGDGGDGDGGGGW